LIDVVDPEDDFSLAEFQDRAYLAIDGVLRRGRVPLLVGGTGLYIRAIVEGMQLPRVAPDLALRESLEGYAAQHGAEALHHRLAIVDAQAASRIDPRNLRRVIRALEVIEKSGRLFSLGSVSRPRYDVLTIGLTTDRTTLYRQIDDRVDWQIHNGLVEETRAVIAQGCPPDRPALAGLGYREVVALLEDRLDLPTAIERIKFETHRFSRQQYNWFRLADPRIQWLTSGPAAAERATALIDTLFHHARQPALEVTA
ncbi:MAG TPA: tRNA (adenosine(37)-N6)-dimethylallyltransferase MiaA, partial [Chloroflexota bacterium]|nr:tRNA (adenosine(37)-N6)-dimethylallyltransferase MiaA [Chloroflexota bacterium]